MDDSDLTTNQKGAIAEMAIAQQAITLGLEVYRPVTEGGRCDLVFGLGNRLIGFNANGRHVTGTSYECPFGPHGTRHTATFRRSTRPGR